jgi:hypothetical protein
VSETLGFKPSQSFIGPFETFNEISLHAPYREWARRMETALKG